MSGRAPTLDSLPLFATDTELGRAVMGDRHSGWPVIAALLETKGLPKVNSLMGGRYVPGIKRFFEVDNGLAEMLSGAVAADGVEDLGAWRKKKPRTARA